MEAASAQGYRTNHPLTDGHTHIDQFAPEDIGPLLDRAREANVRLIIAAGVTLDSCRRVLTLAEAHPHVYAGVGLHPADLTGWVDDRTTSELRRLASNPRVVEWSETGLDYMPHSPTYDLQQDAFRQQIRLAREFGLPLVTHSREADDDTLRLLREEGAGEVGGAWHYFQGDLRLAERVIELGFFISLAKPLLRIPELQAAVEQLPLGQHRHRDRLVPAAVQEEPHPPHGAVAPPAGRREARRATAHRCGDRRRRDHRELPADVARPRGLACQRELDASRRDPEHRPARSQVERVMV